jgi:hypothetical protein
LVRFLSLSCQISELAFFSPAMVEAADALS